ncbi:hypothetical protein HQ544_04335 [Candidatus Falkowbacteria bacterium]|nr:hypothetical protein [Candidatus Falkowbacteria bacterium]
MKKLFFLTVLISVFVLAGCGLSDDGGQTTDDGDGEPGVTDDGSEPVDDGDEGDETGDWQTYRNEELGVELDNPGGWLRGRTKTGVVYFTDEEESFRVELSLSENIVSEDATQEEALKLEAGRMAMPLINEEYLTINDVPSYRVMRQLKKGEVIFEGDPENETIIEVTDTEVLFSYLKDKDLYYLSLAVKGESPQQIIETFDVFARGFKFTE